MTELLKGKYRLEVCIGRGGMAEVFAGRTVGAEGFSQRVAIKRILPCYSLDAAFRDMFAGEARLSAHLRHSNVVRVFDFDQDEAGCLFLVMEYVDGVDLDGLLHTGRLPLPVILFVIGEMLRGLAYVHELPAVEGGLRGLVHRDVSPQNVLLSWDGAVQVSDFGIAKARTATQAGASLMIKGKPAYMSPEQVGSRALDGRSDVFAVGIMLWEMLCGEPLFHDPDDMRATLGAVLFGDVPPPSTRAGCAVPADLEALTMRMLRRDREARPDATTALAALTACADYPRTGREALATLLAERFPERAPRPNTSRRSRAEPSEESPAPLCGAEATPCVTALATSQGRPRPRLGRDRGSIVGRARWRGLRGVLLGAAVVGGLTGATLRLGLGDNSAAAKGGSRPVQAEPGAIEQARAADVPRDDPGTAPGARDLQSTQQPSEAGALPAGGEAPPARAARSLPASGADTSLTVRRTRASAPAAVRAPAGGGMRIIDLRPETSGPDRVGQVGGAGAR